MTNKRKVLLSLALSTLAATAMAAVGGKTMCQYIAWESMFWPKSLPVSGDNYAKVELDKLLGSAAKFDTLVFSPVFGFGMAAADLKSSDYITEQPSPSKYLDPYRNALPALKAAGTDPIKETVKWCRKHQKEAVVSLPLNFMQLHGKPISQKDPKGTWYSYLYPPFKQKNPGCLLNGGDENDVRWDYIGYCVDYDRADVMKKFTDIAVEIASKYDVDGVMIDFMMTNPVIFGSVATDNVPADAKQLAKLTAMMTTIKSAVDAASQRLGRKVSFSARVPDSVGYCKDIGIDLVAWLDAKMLDFVVFGGRFQLNPWKVTGDFMAKYGVPFYADFAPPGIYVGDDSGWVTDDEQLPRFTRDGKTNAARIAEAIGAGAAGCVYTMPGHHENISTHQVLPAMVAFDKAANRTADKRYLVTYAKTTRCTYAYKGGMKHATVETLESDNPASLAKGAVKLKINVFDDFAALAKSGLTPKVTLVTQMAIPSGITAMVTLNGKEMTPFRKRAGSQYYEVPLAVVKTGANELMVKTKGANKRKQLPAISSAAIEVEFPKEGGK